MKYLVFTFTLLFAINTSAQTVRQVDLVLQFIREEGAAIIGGWAHPLHTPIYFSVDNYGHTYYVKIGFDREKTFYCKYTIYMSEIGEIKAFIPTDCNSPYSWLHSCFDFCNTVKDNIIAKWAQSDDNGKLIRLVGKSLAEFSCKDCCFVRLYQQWHSDGYYSRY